MDDGRNRAGIGRIARIVVVALAMALGLVTATALANSDDDSSGATTGTTGTTQTTPTTTTPKPGFVPLARGKVRVVGTVTSRDEAARTFVLKWRKARTLTVRFERQPQVGRMVQVKGRKLDDGTVQAFRVKVLRGCDDDDVARTARRGFDDNHCDDHRGRGRGHDDHGDDHRGRGRGHDGDGDDDGDDRQVRGRGHDNHDDDHQGRGRGHDGDDDGDDA